VKLLRFADILATPVPQHFQTSLKAFIFSWISKENVSTQHACHFAFADSFCACNGLTFLKAQLVLAAFQVP